MASQQATIHRGSSLPAGRLARAYLLLVILAAGPIYLFCLHQTFKADWHWIWIGLLAAVVGWFPIRLFSVKDRVWLTVGDVFVFVALFHCGVAVAVTVASIEALVFNLRKRPKRVYRWLFNLAQIILVVFLVGQVFLFMSTVLDRSEAVPMGSVLLLILAPWVCGFLYYALSSAMTGLAIALYRSQPFLKVWARNIGWYYVSVLGAVLAALTYITAQPWQ